MKKIGLIICMFVILITATMVDAAQKKEALKNKFKAQASKAVVVEEEKKKEGPKKRIQSNVICGYNEPMRVAGYVTNPPFGWVMMMPIDGPQKVKYINAGFSYDLFTQLAENLNLKVANIGYSSYQDAIKALRQGSIDVIVGSYYDKRVLGTGVNLMFPSYFTNPILPLFVKGKEKQVQSWEDLRGLKGVVRQEEMIYSLIYNQIPKDLQIEQVSGSKKAFRKLLTGEADYMITSLYAGEAEVRRYKLIDKIYFSPKALVSPELFFVFSSHTDCYKHKKKLSEELKKIIENKNEYMKTFVSYIDDWGLRFKDNLSLIEEIQEEREKILQQKTTLKDGDSALVEKEKLVEIEEEKIEDETKPLSDSNMPKK